MLDAIYKYESIIRLIAFAGGFSLLGFLEWWKPKRSLTQPRLKRWLNNFSLVVTSTILVRIIYPTAAIGVAYMAEQEHLGFSHHYDMPLWVKFIITFVLLDLTIYLQHVMFHVVPVMWRFHRVHHSDLDCDVTTGMRFHPVEILVSILIKFVAIVATGAPVITVIVFEVVLNLMSMFTHSNIRLNSGFERVLRWFVVTPDMHRLHHSAWENEANSNFSFHISLWDRVFGTYIAQPRNGHTDMMIGLDQFREARWQNLAGMLYMPFRKSIGGYAINYRDTRNAEELEIARKLAHEYEEKARISSRLASYTGAIDQHALVLSIDAQGRIVHANNKFCKTSGYGEAELIGMDYRVTDSGAHSDEFYTDLWAEIEKGNTWHGEICEKKKNGELFWVDASVVPVVSTNGEIEQYIAVMIDITQRIQHEKEIIESRYVAEMASKAKTDFLSNMSHELRTPLNAILGFGQLLEMELLDENQKSNAEEIVHAGKHLLELINEVLDLSRIEAGRLELSIENCSLNTLLNECVSLVEPLAEQREILIFNRATEERDYDIRVDYTRFKQVMLNLLSNAIKYNRQAGTVTITTTDSDSDFIRVEVADTGKGMTNEQRQMLFRPFERIEQYSEVEGTGIGLVISKKIIEAMNGHIGVESNPGEGSVFWLQVRLSKQDQPDSHKLQTASRTVRNSSAGDKEKTILYIEDNPANLRLVENIIAGQTHYKLLSSTDALSGLMIAQSVRPDMILMDINLPGMDGYEAHRLLQENELTSHIPVVAISANAMRSDIRKGKQAGFLHYITKPIEVDELISIVEETLAAGEKAES